MRGGFGIHLNCEFLTQFSDTGRDNGDDIGDIEGVGGVILDRSQLVPRVLLRLHAGSEGRAERLIDGSIVLGG